MCLIVEEDCKIEIAKESIIVKKIIIQYTRAMWKSLFMESVYEYNRILTACKHLKIESPPRFQIDRRIKTPGIIDIGFHSYINIDEEELMTSPQVENAAWSYLAFGKIAHLGQIVPRTCMIPKGAEYCIGKNNQMVSNQLYVPDIERVIV